MTSSVEIEFDPAKDAINLIKHEVSLAEAVDFNWAMANIEEDLRNIYVERRFRATSLLRERLHVVVYCVRGPLKRIISLRKANAREAQKYANSN